MATENMAVETTDSRSERFEVAFNNIHSLLKRMAKNCRSDGFVDLLYAARDQYSIVRHHFDELKQYARLRNAMVHEKRQIATYIAEPHLDVVEEIEKIFQRLSEPVLARQIATKPVKSFSTDTPLKEALNLIKKTGYSQFPVYQDDEFAGLLTEHGIVQWLADADHSDSMDVSLQDILAYEEKDTVRFLSESENVDEVEKLFTDKLRGDQKLEAVLLTKNGKHNEPPLGIVTTWDLVKIFQDVPVDAK
jgi:predicted transcriptional regulator